MEQETPNIIWKNIGFIQKVLGWLYHLDKIQTSWFEKHEESYQVTFSFLPYQKVMSPLTHVSSNQIHEWIMEALYLVVWDFVLSEGVDNVTFDDFLNARAVALFREFQVKYKKEIYSSQENTLDFKIMNHKNVKWKFSTMEIGFSGFCTWKTKLVIGTADLVRDILK